MRDGQPQLRGEAGRVAERVRGVVAAGRGETDEPDESGGLLERLGDRLPVRVDPGRRPVLALGVVVLVVAVITGVWVLASRPRSMPVSDAAPVLSGAAPLVTSPSGRPPPSGTGVATAAPSASSSPVSTQVVVDVAGKVARPGLYRLPPGSRVDDAIKAAGGALHGVDLTSLNLAAPLVDGQQIAVGRPGAVGVVAPAGSGAGPAAPASGSAGAAGAPVNLNSATLEQLEDLPGIGPALAQRILDYRSEHGTFGSVAQLDDVSGIGTVTFERLKPLVTV